MGGSPSPPTPPNPQATANTQTGLNIGSSEASDIMNMVNQSTPWGSLSYNQTGSDTIQIPQFNSAGSPTGTSVPWTVPTFSAQQSYSPAGQQAQQYEIAGGLNTGEALSNLSAQNLGNLSTPINLSDPSIENTLFSEYGPEMSYIQGNQNQQLEDRLMASGASPLSVSPTGASPWDQAMNNQTFNNQQAWNSLLTSGRQEAVSELEAQKQFPLQLESEMASLGSPTYPSFGTTPSVNIAPANYEGDVQASYQDQMAAYQEEVANQNAQMGGIFGLAGSLLGGFGI